MHPVLFYIFSAISVIGAIALVCFRNPVSSALSMVVSFLGLAALFVGLDAFFVGVIQVLVYTGAIMVLFLFIIMLLDLKIAENVSFRKTSIAGGIIIPFLFLTQLLGVLQSGKNVQGTPLDLPATAAQYEKSSPAIAEKLSEGSLPDVKLLGHTIFNDFNFPFQIVGVILLVATIGVVVLSKRQKA